MSEQPDRRAGRAAPNERVEIDGVGLEVRRAVGTGSVAPPLVFLHHGLGSVELWRSFPDDVRHAVGDPSTLVYSRAGYGRSDPVALPRPASYMHDEADRVLPAVLATFGLTRPVLVGHSDGGSIALLAAGGGLDVAALVLLAPHVFVEDLSVSSIAAAGRDYDAGGLRSRLARYHDHVEVAFRGWNDVWLSPQFRSWDITDRLPMVTCPVLVIQGDDDPFGTTAQIDAIEAGVSGRFRRVMVPGGHDPHLDSPDATRAAVIEFLADV